MRVDEAVDFRPKAVDFIYGSMDFTNEAVDFTYTKHKTIQLMVFYHTKYKTIIRSTKLFNTRLILLMRQLL